MFNQRLWTTLILLGLSIFPTAAAQDVASATAQLDPPPDWITAADRRLIQELSDTGYSAFETTGSLVSHGGGTQVFTDWQRLCNNLSKGLDWSGRKLTRDEWRGLFRGADKAQQWLELKNRLAQQADKLGRFVKAINIADAGFKALGHAWEGDTSGMLITLVDEAGECLAVAAGSGAGAVAGPGGSVVGAGLAQEAWNVTGHAAFERMAQHVKNLEIWQARASDRTKRLMGGIPEFKAYLAGSISDAEFKTAVHKIRDEYKSKRERIRRALTVQAKYDPTLTPLIDAWWNRQPQDPAEVQRLRTALSRAGFRPLDPATCQPLPPPTDQATVQSSQNATLVRAVAREEPRQLFTAAGGFSEQPVDVRCDAGPTLAPLLLEAGGTLRLKLEGSPPVPCRWSLYNSGVSMTLGFAPRLGDGYGRSDNIGSLKLSCERDSDDDVRGSAEINLPGPGRLSLGIGAPRGSGPLSGNCFSQGYSASVDLIEVKPDVPSPAGQALQPGDRLRTGTSGHALFDTGSGTQALLGPHSDVGYGPAGLDLASGSVRVYGPAHLPVTVDGRTVTPDGTEFTVTRTRDGGQVTVWEGAVTVTDAAGQVQPVAAGQTYGWPDDTLSDTKPETDQREWLDGLPLSVWAALDASPQAAGGYPLVLENGTPANGWLWLDPKADAQLTATGADGVQVSTPDGNEFWNDRIDAPRLLHKVTGDFTLEGALQLSSGNDLASAEPLLYAPGFYQGQYADQMQADRMAAHWRILGGGWVRYQNANKLLTLEQRDFHANPTAPDAPIHIRLSRRGEWWRVFWSTDGTHWTLAFREALPVPETVWVGWLFKRLQHDGVTEPAVTTLKDMTLTIAPKGGLGEPEWEFEQFAGRVTVDGAVLTLTHDGGQSRGTVSAQRGGLPLDGDFDVVARYRVLSGFEPGQRQHLYLFARQDARNLAYSGYARDGDALRYQIDMQLNGGWHRYQKADTEDTAGWLRVTRRGGQMQTFQWYEGAWRQLDQFRDTLGSPVFLGVALDNASDNSPAAAEFAIEHLNPDSAGPDWLPPAEILQPLTPPPGLNLPTGVTVRAYRAPFALSGLFLDQGGAALLLGGEQRKQTLIALDTQGHSRPLLTHELLAGRNRKSGLDLGERLLIGVDGWYDGGNRHSGLYELTLDGNVTPVALQANFGGLSDVIDDGAGGWYFADFEGDNVWQRLPDGTETPLISDKAPYGPAALARDPDTQTLYMLNWNGGGAWPFGSEPAIYTVQDGTVTVRSLAPDATDFADIAYNPGGVLPRGLYASHPATHQVLAIHPDGTQTAALTGIPRPQGFEFDPLTGALTLIYDDRHVLWMGLSPYERASRLREAGAALQAAGKLPEALEKYRASQEIYPDPRLDAHIRLIETHTGHRRP